MTAPDLPSRTLPSGDEFPMCGFGTWDIDESLAAETVQTALEAGYRHIDTAEGYHNETGVGTGIAQSDVDREDVFLTSKVLPSNLNYENVLEACEASLERLGTSYLDCYLIHWPNPAISLRETLDAMATLHDEGLVRNVGVSNFTAYQLRFARRVSDVPIAVDQVELHPWFQQRELREYCDDCEVTITAAAPLARTQVFEDPTIQDIAEEYDRSPAQVALRWLLQSGIVSVPKSTTPDHIRSNLEIGDWELEPDAIERIDDIDRTERIYMIDLEDDTYGIAE